MSARGLGRPALDSPVLNRFSKGPCQLAPRSRTSPARRVSPRGAVSFALNDRPGVADATRDRILAVAAELGFTPSHRGAGAVLVAGADASDSCRAAAGDAQRRPVLPRLHRRHRVDPGRARPGPAAPGGPRPGVRAPQLRDASPPSGRVDGVFLTDLRVDDPRPALLESLGLPTVVIAPRSDRVPLARRRRRRPPRHRGRRRAPGGPRAPAHRPCRRPDRVRPRPLPPAGVGRHPGGVGARGVALRRGPTSHPPGAPTPPDSCSTSPSRRPRSSTPTT